MVSNTQNIDSILAVGRLYEFTSNKRFHLINNEFLEDNIGVKAQEINSEIKNSRGIDVFEAKDEKDLIEYQRILNGYTTRITNQTFGIKSVGEEMQLVESQTRVPSEKLNEYAIEIAPDTKDLIKQLHLNVPETIKYIRNSDQVIFFKKFQSFLVSKKIKHNSKERILLAWLFTGGYQDIKTNDKHLLVIPEGKKVDTFSAHAVFLLKEEHHRQNANNPVGLFFQFIETYGIPFAINNQIRKVHLKEVLPPFITKHGQLVDYFNIKTASALLVANGTSSRIAFTADIAFAIDVKKLVNDFLNGKV